MSHFPLPLHSDGPIGSELQAAMRDRLSGFELLFQCFPDSLQVFDLTGSRLWHNPKAAEVFGTALLQDPAYRLPADPFFQTGNARDFIQRALAGESVTLPPTDFATSTGPKRLHARCFPLCDPEGTLTAVVLQHREAESLSSSTHDTVVGSSLEGPIRLSIVHEHAIAPKENFLAILAHELRNPLAPIRNAIQILRNPRIRDVEARQAWDIMDRQVHLLVRLLDDLLDVSRAMRGKVDLKREVIELRTVIARAVEAAQPWIESQRQTLTIDVPADSLLVEVDPIRVAQAIGNLLANASKYTAAEGLINIIVAQERNYVFIKVRDNGIGIAPEMFQFIFDLFTQVDQATSKVHGGLGIGLTLARSLIELHGGTIEAFSEGLSRGSEFVVKLPLLSQTSISKVTPGQTPQVTLPHQSKIRLLVVDDNIDSANSLAMLLRLQGLQVLVAHDGLTAIGIAEREKPDAIFLDLGMPDLDGYEVAQRLRMIPELKATRLIALTGWGKLEDRLRSTAAGFDEHLVKPADLNALREIVKEIEAQATSPNRNA